MEAKARYDEILHSLRITRFLVLSPLPDQIRLQRLHLTLGGFTAHSQLLELERQGVECT